MRILSKLIVFSALISWLQPINCNIFIASIVASHLRTSYRTSSLESDVSKLKDSVAALELMMGAWDRSDQETNLLPPEMGSHPCSSNSSWVQANNLLDWLQNMSVRKNVSSNLYANHDIFV